LPQPILSSFYLHDTTPPPPYTLSLHDALPISAVGGHPAHRAARPGQLARHPRRAILTGVDVRDLAPQYVLPLVVRLERATPPARDRKSTRLNSSHLVISYAVFCLKKKK